MTSRLFHFELEMRRCYHRLPMFRFHPNLKRICRNENANTHGCSRHLFTLNQSERDWINKATHLTLRWQITQLISFSLNPVQHPSWDERKNWLSCVLQYDCLKEHRCNAVVTPMISLKTNIKIVWFFWKNVLQSIFHCNLFSSV